jgi:selenocysteine lyase/cysteine desulfurase
MPITQRFAYFDHAAVAPLPRTTATAMHRWLQQATELGDTVWPQWSESVERTRQLAAQLINARPSEIALVPSTTFGLNLVARGFPWQAGENVVVPANEFPSNLYPWMSLAELGVETRRVPIESGKVTTEQLMEACDAATRLIAVSWVGYVSGWRIDVADLCRAAHARGIWVMLDAIQGLGVFPLDVQATGVDFVAADGHKWMLGPEGAALLYIRGDRLSHLRSVMSGWNSVEHRYDFSKIDWQPRAEAARFEGGSQNMAGMIGLGASLQLLQSWGLSSQSSAIADRVLRISDFAQQQLRELGASFLSPGVPGHHSGIITFCFPNVEPNSIRQSVLAENIVLSVRGGGVRLSLHAYNTEEEVERFIQLLKRMI